MMRQAVLSIALLSCVAGLAYGSDAADVGANGPAQSAADVLKDFAGSDGAFLAAGLLKTTFDKDNLATMLQYPSDGVVVLNLTGAQIRQAFERSVSFYPQPNTSFLQISGFDVTFKKGAPPDQRIVSVNTSSGKLDEGKTYSIAMPMSLAKGGLGFFKIWDRAKIAKTFDNKTMEDVLAGKKVSETQPRWSAQA